MKCIMDTNVPTKASCLPSECKEEEQGLFQASLDFVHTFINDPESKLVLDMDGEIVKEYQRNINNSGMGQLFLRWLYTYMGKMDVEKDSIKLIHKDDEYEAFPKDEKLGKFDVADRKFVALALSHEEKPPIVQGADGKWIGFEKALQKHGIQVRFLDRPYAEEKYKKKIVNKRH